MQQRNSKFEVSIIEKGLVNDRKGQLLKPAFSFLAKNQSGEKCRKRMSR
jgi:hypothetical protein